MGRKPKAPTTWNDQTHGSDEYFQIPITVKLISNTIIARNVVFFIQTKYHQNLSITPKLLLSIIIIVFSLFFTLYNVSFHSHFIGQFYNGKQHKTNQ